jgi:hypothetical protein
MYLEPITDASILYAKRLVFRTHLGASTPPPTPHPFPHMEKSDSRWPPSRPLSLHVTIFNSLITVKICVRHSGHKYLPIHLSSQIFRETVPLKGQSQTKHLHQLVYNFNSDNQVSKVVK